MANSTPRDADFIPVFSAVDTNGLTYPWEIDSVTGRVLMEIYISTDDAPNPPVNRALKDANFRNTLTGSSDASNTPLAVAIDQTNGYMGVDVFIE